MVVGVVELLLEGPGWGVVVILVNDSDTVAAGVISEEIGVVEGNDVEVLILGINVMGVLGVVVDNCWGKVVATLVSVQQMFCWVS